jgi:hypothetical protein
MAQPRRSLRKLLLLQLAIALAALAGVEVSYRVWLRLTHEPYSADAAIAKLVEVLNPMRESIPQAVEPRDGAPAPPDAASAQQRKATNEERVYLHPFFGFEHVRANENVQLALEGFAKREFANDYKILIVGGSVAGIFGVKGSERLGELLGQDPRFAGRTFHFFGDGRGSWKQPQQLYFVESVLAQGYEVDAVINIDGFNEVALSDHNRWEGAHPLYPSIFKWAPLAQSGDLEPVDLDLLVGLWTARREAEALVDRARNWGLMQSAVLGRMTLRQLHAIRNRWVDAQQGYAKRLLERDHDATIRGPKYEGDAQAAMRLAVDHWAECSRDLQAVCAAHGITYLHVLQPTLHDVGSKVLTKEELASDNAHEAWVEGVHIGYPLLREAGAKLAASGVNFFDATGLFKDVGPPMYFDACHFRTYGNKLFAEAIAPKFLAACDGAR